MHVTDWQQRQLKGQDQRDHDERSGQQERPPGSGMATAGQPAFGGDGAGGQDYRSQAIGIVGLTRHPGEHVSEYE